MVFSSLKGGSAFLEPREFGHLRDGFLQSFDLARLAGLDPILLAMMNEDSFRERLKEMWNDLLLTDKNRFEASYDFLTVGGVSNRLRALPLTRQIVYSRHSHDAHQKPKRQQQSSQSSEVEKRIRQICPCHAPRNL